MWTRLPALLAVAVTLGCGGSEDDRLASLPAVSPDAVEEFELPATLVAPPDGLAARTFPRGEAGLRGPHFALGVSWVATAEAIFEDDPLVRSGALRPRRPAGGEELMIFAVDPEYVGGQWDPGDHRPLAELVFGNERLPMRMAPLRSADDPGVLAVVSVPKGRPVHLRVTDTGRVQTLDVRAGRRGPDAIPGYYRPDTQRLTFIAPFSATIAVRGTPYEIPLKILEMPSAGTVPVTMLAPWTPDQGWAGDGFAWLLLPNPVPYGEPASGKPALELVIDEPAAFRVRLPGGREVREWGGGRRVDTLSAHTGPVPPRLVFGVPAGFTAGTFLIDLGTAEMIARFDGVAQVAQWRPAPPPVEILVRLSGS